ncbi:MAG: two-component system response regulator [Melioribacteraceae bacterium]|nr:MAG: two-component system response regulator [Melioribacteraceae bacterium]
MYKIIFADREEKILKILKRILETENGNLKTFFFNDAEEAAAALSESDVDMVVCDLDMYVDSGQPLLDYTKENYPGVIRVILTGYSLEATALQAIQKAHQLFLKPIESFQLKDKIYKTLSLKEYIQNENLRKLIAGINEIPVLPEFYYKLEKMLEQPDVSIAEVKNLIAHDPALVAKILQLVNSAFFGFSKNISDLTQAISFLGLKIIKTLVLYLSVTATIKIAPQLLKVQNEIWHHSLTAASIARDIAKELHFTQDEIDNAYAAGILHDIGKLVLLSYNNYYEEVTERSKTLQCSFYEAELSYFNTSHGDVGAYLLGLWGLPDLIVESVHYHHHELFKDDDEVNIKSVLQITELVSRDDLPDPEEIIKNYIIENPKRSNKSQDNFN